ncbi:MAG TPA: hypothetical protein VN455_10025 [Methanotrichaceae archaeon]|nr:hypothetical protein [Methanotrichaceae archaeon]
MTTSWADDLLQEPSADENGIDGAAHSLGKAIADFQPETDGFGFDNYGNETLTADLTPVEIRRLFGDKVCASKYGGECILTPPAKRWMDENNREIGGGHCGGMAILSVLMYFGLVDPSRFGSDTVNDLVLEGNEPLQREIAYWWATSGETPADLNNISGPVAVLDALERIQAEGKDASESYYLSVCKPGEGDCHAVAPIRVADAGDGVYDVQVYDPNYHDITRTLKIDRDSDTFTFEFSPDPTEDADIYTGKDLTLRPNSRRLEQQECSCCEEDGAGADGLRGNVLPKQSAAKYVSIWLHGPACLLIADEQGRRIGYAGRDIFVNEIPGARIERQTDGAKPESMPVFILPAGLNLTIDIDGSWLDRASRQEVTLIGPGYDLAVEDIWLDPGEKDYIDVSTPGRKDYRLTFRTNYTESPDIIIGTETTGADYEFVVRGTRVEPGGRLSTELDMDHGKFILNTIGNREPGRFEMVMHRIDDKGEQFFGNDDILLEPNDSLYLDFLSWKRDGSRIPLGIDHGSTGIVDETIELKDESDFCQLPRPEGRGLV